MAVITDERDDGNHIKRCFFHLNLTFLSEAVGGNYGVGRNLGHELIKDIQY